MSVLLLRITKEKNSNNKWQYFLNMPEIDLQILGENAKPSELPEIKVLNDSGEGIHLFFADTHSPCAPEEYKLSDKEVKPLLWKLSFPVNNYTYTVATDAVAAAAAATGLVGKGVAPTNGTIDVQPMGS
jgi:hypothetical protein